MNNVGNNKRKNNKKLHKNDERIKFGKVEYLRTAI
jgi:hypothetical protein